MTRTLSLTVLFLALTTSFQASLIPGRWEKLDSQPSNTRMLIKLNSGGDMECSLQ